MYAQKEKSKEDSSRGVANSVVQKKSNMKPNTENINYNPKTIQLRKLRADEVGDNMVESGIASIFDSPSITNGPLYTKDVEVESSDAEVVIAAYHTMIAPIGKNARRLTNIPNPAGRGTKKEADAYTDKYIANPAGELGKKHVSAKNIKTISSRLLATPENTTNLGFTVNMQPNIAIALLNRIWSDKQKNEYIGTIDPFIAQLTFKNRNHVKGETDWRFDTQFASSGTGYITNIVDGKNDASASIVTSDDFESHAHDRAEDAGPRKNKDFIYSSTHDRGEDSFENKIASLDNIPEPTDNRRATKKKRKGIKSELGTHAAAFDAITWMAAEGARFKPVAELGGKAKPEASFYTIDPDEPGYRSVTLAWLMTNWGNNFKKEYGISKKFMVRIIEDQGNHLDELPDKPRYNLDTGTYEV